MNPNRIRISNCVVQIAEGLLDETFQRWGQIFKESKQKIFEQIFNRRKMQKMQWSHKYLANDLKIKTVNATRPPFGIHHFKIAICSFYFSNCPCWRERRTIASYNGMCPCLSGSSKQIISIKFKTRAVEANLFFPGALKEQFN